MQDSGQNRKSVCAVIVTHNRKELLARCLDSLVKQSRPLNAIYVVDNASSDGTTFFLAEKGILSKSVMNRQGAFSHKDKIGSDLQVELVYMRLAENTGGAGGFCEGLNRACDDGYDWVWLMDDDGTPASDALELLLQESKPGDAALSCLVVSNKHKNNLSFRLPVLDDEGKFTRYRGKRYFEKLDEFEAYSGKVYLWANPFNGILVNSAAVRSVGEIDKRLFIWGDEQDYFFRLRAWGRVCTVVAARHFHPDANHASPPVWKKFYGFRNELYLNKKYRNFPKLRFFVSSLRAFPYFLKRRALNTYFQALYESFKL